MTYILESFHRLTLKGTASYFTVLAFLTRLDTNARKFWEKRWAYNPVLLEASTTASLVTKDQDSLILSLTVTVQDEPLKLSVGLFHFSRSVSTFVRQLILPSRLQFLSVLKIHPKYLWAPVTLEGFATCCNHLEPEFDEPPSLHQRRGPSTEWCYA